MDYSLKNKIKELLNCYRNGNGRGKGVNTPKSKVLEYRISSICGMYV